MLPLPRGALALVLAVVAALAGAPAGAADVADDGLPSLTVGTAVHTVSPAVQEYCWTYPDVTTEQGELGASSCGREGRRTPTLRHDGALQLAFAGSGWRWRARYESSRSSSPACRSTQRVRRLDEHTYRVRRPAYPGTYRVTLTGRGPEGRIVAVFVWRYGTGRCS